MKAKIKDRAPLPEDDDDGNDRQQQHQQRGKVEGDGTMPPPSTETRTPEQIDKEYKELISRQVSIFIEKGYKLIQLHFK